MLLVSKLCIVSYAHCIQVPTNAFSIACIWKHVCAHAHVGVQAFAYIRKKFCTATTGSQFNSIQFQKVLLNERKEMEIPIWNAQSAIGQSSNWSVATSTRALLCSCLYGSQISVRCTFAVSCCRVVLILADTRMRIRWLSALISLTWALTLCDAKTGTFTLENDRFVKDGRPIRLISGRWIPDKDLSQLFSIFCLPLFTPQECPQPFVLGPSVVITAEYLLVIKVLGYSSLQP